jgi:hypothetical protein
MKVIRRRQPDYLLDLEVELHNAPLATITNYKAAADAEHRPFYSRWQLDSKGQQMQRFRYGHETFAINSGETLELTVSEPGECVDLADFASRTILA